MGNSRIIIKVIAFHIWSSSFSCNDIPKESKTIGETFFQADKCRVDGGNIYIRCDDNRQKIIELGFGKFFLVQAGKLSESLKFCGEGSFTLIINVKNAHLSYNEIKAGNGFKVQYHNSFGSDCVATKELKSLRGMRELLVEFAPIEP